MLESIRRALPLPLPRVNVAHGLALAVLLTFGGLLLQDRIPPFAIYLAQIFLMF